MSYLQEILNARSFGEAYVALVKMKMNLLALGIFEDVELTMDTGNATLWTFMNSGLFLS